MDAAPMIATNIYAKRMLSVVEINTSAIEPER
jgi:hypothetical protein